MSREVLIPIQVLTQTAGGVCTKHRFAFFDSSGAIDNTVTDEIAYGVFLDDAVADEAVSIGTDGVFTVEASEAIVKGDIVSSTATGKAALGKHAAVGDMLIGIAEGDALADGDLIPVKLKYLGVA